MMRTILIPVVLAGLLALLTASQVHAYGACHSSYTAVGPNGAAYHGSTTAAAGPNGAYEHTSTAAEGPNGTAAYHGSSVQAYSPSMYHGYSAVGSSTTVNGNSVVHSTTVYP